MREDQSALAQMDDELAAELSFWSELFFGEMETAEQLFAGLDSGLLKFVSAEEYRGMMHYLKGNLEQAADSLQRVLDETGRTGASWQDPEVWSDANLTAYLVYALQRTGQSDVAEPLLEKLRAHCAFETGGSDKRLPDAGSALTFARWQPVCCAGAFVGGS